MTCYRDDLDAARARIETLEARIREREASLEVRDAELAELRAEVDRGKRGQEGGLAGPRLEAGAGSQRSVLVALGACMFLTTAAYAMVRPARCGMSRSPVIGHQELHGDESPRARATVRAARALQASQGQQVSASAGQLLPIMDPALRSGDMTHAAQPVVESTPPSRDPDDATHRMSIHKLANQAVKAAAQEMWRCPVPVGSATKLGVAFVTFEPTGEVDEVRFADESFARTSAGHCVQGVLREVRIAPYEVSQGRTLATSTFVLGGSAVRRAR
ncbi:hypothetical protein [Chondromyces crocatus]|uniref:Uncharacterized protein n=1 Tax=Chondromyces crocatus TaxID=52 RepID=A0A0K1E8E3_CHOCO|nr:hypothetical protein [Chondromyces crocatus]AKT37119.1 uncharacterized protein CMC5_012490 [Chondromyces crocatus]